MISRQSNSFIAMKISKEGEHHGGRTCHAAIVSRELGIPAIVGTGKATEVLREGQEVTRSWADGDQAYIFEGILPSEATTVNLEGVLASKIHITRKEGMVDGTFYH